MSEHEDFYTPEQVDEQVDALLQARGMPLRDQRLASDLHSLLEDRDEDAYSLQRVLQKLMEDDNSAQQPGKVIPFADLRSQQQEQGRFVAMPDILKQSAKTSRMKPVLRTLTTLAAVLVVAVLVGSMMLVLNASRQKQTGTTLAHSGPPAQTLAEHQGQIIYKSQALSGATAAVWSPDGKRVAAATDGKVKSWDARTGQHVLNYPTSGDLYIINVAWSPDGSRLAVAGSSKIYLFDAKTAQLMHAFPAQSVAFNDSGNSLLSSTGAVPLSSTVSLSGGTPAFENVVWSSDGKSVAAAYNYLNGSQHVVYVWDAASGAVVKTLTGFPSDIIDISWSPRGNMLATVGIAKQATSPEVNVWNTTTWQVVKQYSNTTALEWSPNGNQLALVEGAQSYASGKDVRIVDTQTWQTVRQFAGPQGATIHDIHWSPDSNRLALETQDTADVIARISIWSATNGTLLYSFSREHSVYNAAWSPDSKHISSVQSTKGQTGEYMVYILIWAA